MRSRTSGGAARWSPLSETLATYSAMMVMEKTYDAEMVRRFYDFEMDLYLRGRASSPRAAREVPLLEGGPGYVQYHKGALAMHTLCERIGENRVNTALRRCLEKYRDAGPPGPTSYDLYDELRAVTPDSLHALLEDLCETITLWDVRAERARVEPTGTGEYRVTIDVVARKLRADSIGNESEVPMNDLVEIGVFAPGGDDGIGESLYLKRHRIRSGEQTIRISIPRHPRFPWSEPARAGIDPYHKLIDREGDDNVVEVETVAADAVGTGR